MSGAPSTSSGQPEAVPVTRLLRRLRGVLEADQRFREIWVAGEVVNLVRAPLGPHLLHAGPTPAAPLRCAFFRNRNAGQARRLGDGEAVLAYGSLSLYEERGELQLIVDFVQPAGAGAAAAEFERRRARFEQEGALRSRAQARAPPRFPRRVGVVTSPQGAVLHDVRTVLARRWPLATLLVQPTAVQGAEAAGEIASAIRAVASPRSASGQPLRPARGRHRRARRGSGRGSLGLQRGGGRARDLRVPGAGGLGGRARDRRHARRPRRRRARADALGGGRARRPPIATRSARASPATGRGWMRRSRARSTHCARASASGRRRSGAPCPTAVRAASGCGRRGR